MSDNQFRLLSLLKQLPGRLTVEQTAQVLGFNPADIPILVANGLLKPLGRPPPNGVKFFAAVEILELAKDRVWLAKATNAIHWHWRAKNGRRKGYSSGAAALAS